jgi:hypothetical protein
MTLDEAKKIMGHLVQCHFYFQIGGDEKPAPINYGLEEMLEANRIIKQANDDAESVKGARYIHVTFDPRAIAAFYVASNYEGGSPEEPNVITMVNDRVLLMVDKKFINEKIEDEDPWR